MRIIFMGTPDFAVPTLTGLVAQGHDVCAVYSQPPRPGGRRGLGLTKSPVHRHADAFGLPVRTPSSLKSEDEQSAFRDLEADAAVVVAYGLLLPEPVLEGTRRGCFNGHASLLPRWRGAAPIHRAIMAGDRESGVMVMKMDTGLDTGDIALEDRTPIGPDTTAGELHDALAQLCADLMVRAMAALERGSLTLSRQPDEGVIYAKKIAKDETRVDWLRPAEVVHNHIRGLSPVPGAWCEMRFDHKWERVKLLRSRLAKIEQSHAAGSVVTDNARIQVACLEGAVELLALQRAGGKPMPAADLLRGARLMDIR
ncbi:methionyl-tRNA formyltransferase [Oricola cellulosilytica]|uniref:Methionyl-tRNA formyltransferase n=1 Tax=Oricola cellulosilytica TaxID=1429082 RepID=A0A4R0PF64_9HYPH|nr:methionyl-tRNA formyltransferase [Oricola cellulosilytica]TCD16466.1 methionyl-tRNA formyltransferase [Oricola cellulosilytica]